MLTVEQLCALLKVKKQWVYDHGNDGSLPVIRLTPRSWRFRRSRIERWLEERQ